MLPAKKSMTGVLMQNDFNRFLRTGGNGEFVFLKSAHGWFGRRVDLSIKAEIPNYLMLRNAFAEQLDDIAAENARLLLAAIADSFSPPLTGDDLADFTEAREATLDAWDQRMETLWAEWHSHPARLRPVRQAMEAGLALGFRGLVNELRQRALGIEQYIWRSQGDGKDRESHADYSGQVFDWDTPPPEGKHPGQDINCRCWAVPHLPDEPDYLPDTGASYWAGRAAAEWDGTWDAVGEFLGQVVTSISEFPDQARAVGRYVNLRVEEALGTLSPQEAEDLAEIRRRIDAAVATFVAAFQNATELAEAFADYVLATERRVALIDEAYREGLATQAQLEDAIRERAWLETMLGLNIAPGILAPKLLARLGRRHRPDAPDGLVGTLAAEIARLRRHPAEPDWDVLDNPGIAWSGPIRSQGEPWEDLLEAGGDYGLRSPPTFPTFDFFDFDSGLATSAKTLDTRAPTYVDRPSRIFGRLRDYIDRIELFEDGQRRNFTIQPGQIEPRRLELAVPFNTTPEQVIQIQRAIDYATDRGIEVNVRFVQ
ncbi:hypothetical protein Ga0609869_003155 [Rhodovulum iodosum]|uniref:Phage head morphogenesis domain-containing protein n=1 Tax=Rhodovulum iodosum TaxID=68291 RepID=A0ABV3XWR5_9RHOB|nr:minor capsid protein [Rhodovulum robiginosum]RSK34161.1 hypothetical protein EJA01_08525 [Rhodovulum robiginosum]